jgi:hypothetical protein
MSRSPHVPRAAWSLATLAIFGALGSCGPADECFTGLSIATRDGPSDACTWDCDELAHAFCEERGLKLHTSSGFGGSAENGYVGRIEKICCYGTGIL